MKKYIITAVSILLLSGCSALGTGVIDAINPLKQDKGGIEANVQLGKNNYQEKTEKKALVQIEAKGDSTTTSTTNTSNDNKADVINQATSSITNNDIPVWLQISIIGIAFLWGLAVDNPFKKRRERLRIKERDKDQQDMIKLLMEKLPYVEKQASIFP